jgi:hypothetical protein
MSLARLWQQQDKCADAGALLAPIYEPRPVVHTEPWQFQGDNTTVGYSSQPTVIAQQRQ